MHIGREKSGSNNKGEKKNAENTDNVEKGNKQSYPSFD
jgi:hypothetical protein